MFYIRVKGDPTIWLVKNDVRMAMYTMRNMYEHGLHPVKLVSEEERDQYPIVDSLESYDPPAEVEEELSE